MKRPSKIKMTLRKGGYSMSSSGPGSFLSSEDVSFDEGIVEGGAEFSGLEGPGCSCFSISFSSAMVDSVVLVTKITFEHETRTIESKSG